MKRVRLRSTGFCPSCLQRTQPTARLASRGFSFSQLSLQAKEDGEAGNADQVPRDEAPSDDRSAVKSSLFDPFFSMEAPPSSEANERREGSSKSWTLSREYLKAGSAPEPNFKLYSPPSRTQARKTTAYLTPEERSAFAALFKHVQKRDPQSQPSSSAGGVIGELSDFERLRMYAREEASRRRSIKNQYAASLREGTASSISAEELEQGRDRAREAMAACQTEPQLWAWAEGNIWGERQKGAPVQEGEQEGEQAPPPYGMQSPFYATALGDLLMRFRDTFRSPHAALAVYERTRALGLESFVIGCGAFLYLEVIRTRWGSLRDLKGVLDAVREARRAGVLSATGPRRGSDVKLEEQPLRQLIEKIRNEARQEVLSGKTEGTLGLFGSPYAGLFGQAGEVQEVDIDFVGRDKLRMVDEIGMLIGIKKKRPSEDALGDWRPVSTPRARDVQPGSWQKRRSEFSGFEL